MASRPATTGLEAKAHTMVNDGFSTVINPGAPIRWVAGGLLIGLLGLVSPRPVAAQEAPVGLGFLSTPLFDGYTLYVYDALESTAPADSMQLYYPFPNVPDVRDYEQKQDWLLPEYLKPDYGFIYFRCLTLGLTRALVVTHREKGTTFWVDRRDLSFTDWATFLLSMNSVERLDPAARPIRTDPQPGAAPAEAAVQSTRLLTPLAVHGDWLKVSAWSEETASAGWTGWIRWRDGDRLLVTYSPLS